MATRDPIRSPDRDRDDAPNPRPAKPDTADRRVLLSVLLLVGAFVLMVLFFAAVIVIKTQFATPSTRPAWQNTPFGPQPNNPWDRPGFGAADAPPDFDDFERRTQPTIKK